MVFVLPERINNDSHIHDQEESALGIFWRRSWCPHYSQDACWVWMSLASGPLRHGGGLGTGGDMSSMWKDGPWSRWLDPRGSQVEQGEGRSPQVSRANRDCCGHICSRAGHGKPDVMEQWQVPLLPSSGGGLWPTELDGTPTPPGLAEQILTYPETARVVLGASRKTRD